nr:MAG TPA: hypothetical protein [Caudoviricetes sp.]
MCYKIVIRKCALICLKTTSNKRIFTKKDEPTQTASARNQ